MANWWRWITGQATDTKVSETIYLIREPGMGFAIMKFPGWFGIKYWNSTWDYWQREPYYEDDENIAIHSFRELCNKEKA